MHAKGVIAAAVVALLAACPARKRAGDPALRGQLADCAQGFENSVHASGAGKLRALIAGCPHACPGLPEYGQDGIADESEVTELLDSCKLFCTSEARDAWNQAAPAARFAALIDQCGPESYALTAASAPLMSPDWAALLRIHEWLERHRDHADADTRATLERAGMHAHFRLPLPARLQGVYALPGSRAGQPVETAFYVIVEAGGAGQPRLRGGAIPVARVRPGDLERRPVPGGEFPGRPLDLPAGDYAGLVRLLEGMHPEGSHATIASTPLVLSDRATPVRALIQATVALGTPRFAVGVSGLTALAHPIEIEHLTTTGSAAPVIKVAADGFTVIGGDKDVYVARHEGAAERLARELVALSVQWAPQDEIEVDLPAGATLADLVQILDIITESNFRVALLRAATP